MAKGISNRVRLSMRDHTRDLDGAITDLQRWADYLPFGSFGFHVASTANGLAIAPAGVQAIVFNSGVQNREGWFLNPLATPSIGFTVPPGGSGLYAFQGAAYFAANVTAVIQIRKTSLVGVITVIGQEPLVGIDRKQVNAFDYLKDGDLVDLTVRNGGAGNITSTAFAGDTVSPPYPYLKCYRICLA